jgi:hypothetical protein
MSRRAQLLALAGMVLAGVVLVALLGANAREDQRHRVGVTASGPIGTLRPGQEVCQRPVDLDESVDLVGLALSTGPALGPPLRVQVRDLASGKVVSQGRVTGTYRMEPPGNLPVELSPRVPADRTVEVCARNEGKRPLVAVGANGTSAGAAFVGRRELDLDWGIYFPAIHKRSHLELVPAVFERASVFRPAIVGPWTYWLALAGLLVGAPALLYRAVRRAAVDDDGAGPSPP